VPKYIADIEIQQNELRKAAVEVFKGNRPLKVCITEDTDRGLKVGEPFIRRP
jgi:hypothetical protein